MIEIIQLMKKVRLMRYLAAMSALAIAAPSQAYEIGNKIYGDNLKEELGLCEATRSEKYIQYQQEDLSRDFPGVEVFTITEDWRSQDLQSKQFPLSKPLIIENPVTGRSIGVFDRNYNKRFRVASYFGRNKIRVRLETIVEGAFGKRMTAGSESVQAFGVKNKNGYVVVNGCDGVFEVNAQIAEALHDYQLVDGKAFVLLSNSGSTGLRINEIGEDTVKAWKTIYADWNPLKDGRKKQVLKD